MTVHLWQSARSVSCPNQQEHTTVVSVTGVSVLFFFCYYNSLTEPNAVRLNFNLPKTQESKMK